MTEQDWSNASWVSARRNMIRQSLKLSARERLLALEELYKTSTKLATLKKSRNKAQDQH